MSRLALVAVLGLAGPAQAQDCAWIDRFVAQDTAPDAEACADGVCRWAFAYRDDAARVLFKAYGAGLEACLGDDVGQGHEVNHPDSYDLREFKAASGTVYLSIKDKAALRQTYVFLRTGP